MSARLAKPAALLPREDAREAALFFVVAALCFLAALAGLGARSAYAAADQWTSQVAGQITVRVRGTEADATRALEIVAKTPGVQSARAVPRAEMEELLRPWLGAAELPTDLPLPRLIAAEGGPGVADAIASALRTQALDARADDHAVWSADVRRATDQAGLMALAAVVLLIATGVAVIAFATHAALLARKDIVEVLHLSGARDEFISGLFERRFLMLGAQAGTAGALLALGTAAFLLVFAKSAGENAWLLPQLGLSLADGMILGLVPLAAGLAAMVAAKVTVMRSLKEMH